MRKSNKKLIFLIKLNLNEQSTKMNNPFIQQFVKFMFEYQEENNIKAKCVTNTQYLYDFVKRNFPNENVKAKAVIVVGYDEVNNNLYLINHLVLYFDNEYLLDCSYEVSTKKVSIYNEMKYFANIKEVVKYCTRINKDTDTLKHISKRHLEFLKHANEKKNGGLVITDKEYYNNQADYVEAKMAEYW